MAVTDSYPQKLNALPGEYRALLINQAKVPDFAVEWLIDQDLATIPLLRALGQDRSTASDTLTSVYEFPDTEAKWKKARIHVLCAHALSFDQAQATATRNEIAAQTGQIVPLEASDLRDKLQKVRDLYPGVFFDRVRLPTGEYMGFLETMVKAGDPHAEPLRKVTNIQMRDGAVSRLQSRGNNILSVIKDLEGSEPANREAYRALFWTMGVAWMAISLAFPHLPYFKNLRLETFEAFASWVTGRDVAGLADGTGMAPKWAKVMELEKSIRDSWWTLVLEGGRTLNDAILQTMGRDPRDPGRVSGLVASILHSSMFSSASSSKGPGKGALRNPRPGVRTDFLKKKFVKGDKDQGPGKGVGKGPKGVRKGATAAPKAFKGKTVFCKAHSKNICYDHHLKDGGCTRSNCQFCHICCPEPGCKLRCDEAGPNAHGLWCH